MLSHSRCDSRLRTQLPFMTSSASELSWPTTTSHEARTFCCFPHRRRPPRGPTTTLPPEPPQDDAKVPPAITQDANFITLFNPDIPMTPNLARLDSIFVMDGFFFDAIRPAAYVTVRDEKAHIPCSVVLNESFIPSGRRKRLMYLGFEYPDGTSLSYIPLRDVILQHRSTFSTSSSSERDGQRISAAYGIDYVYLSIPRVVYYVLVQLAEEAFKQCDGGAKSLLPDAEVRGERVWLFNTEMKQSCKVEGWDKGRRYAKTVAHALKEMGSNLEGDALLFMRFCEDLQEEGASQMKLQFRLHRMMVKGVSRY